MYIFNKILSTGIFPERLKFPVVKPLLKERDISEFSNYRPIALLNSFSKITDKIIYKSLCFYLNDNNILVKEKFDFREKLSTKMATYALLNNVLTSLGKKKFLLVVYSATYKKRLIALTKTYFWPKLSFI